MDLRVTCAIIESNNLILAAQRSKVMSLSMKWEFPGGKLEEGENDIQCLHREIMEELNLEIDIIDRLSDCVHIYPDKQIVLVPFVCRISGGDLQVIEHHEVRWLQPGNLPELDWAPADLLVLDRYIAWLKP